MNILVLNVGSSSIKFSLFAANEERDEVSLLLNEEFDGTDAPSGALASVFETLHNAPTRAIDAVGYRVVHSGAEINDHVRLTDDILNKLEAAAEFAPLHEPETLAVIRETMKWLPHVPHFACFDTVFHQTMPAEASVYAIPEEYRKQGVRRYGFHGLSCESIVRQIRLAMPMPARMAIAHLGSGCSVTALLHGESVDTTMGLTPAGGIVMGTRPGDLDPGLLLYLLRLHHGSDGPNDIEKMLNHNAGMVALTALPNDMQQVRKAAAAGDQASVLALKIFTRSVRKAIGGFAWLLGGLDAIVFTGGIGEHDAATRAEILSGSEVSINSLLNEAKADGVRRISASESKTAVFAVPAQEDLVIALHVKRMVQAAI